MLDLLQERDARRAAEAERRRVELRDRLRAALRRLLPGRAVWVFGSVTMPGQFTGSSDLDIAVVERELPENMPLHRLQAALSEEVACRVDVVDLESSRFRERILSQGEEWCG